MNFFYNLTLKILQRAMPCQNSHRNTYHHAHFVTVTNYTAHYTTNNTLDYTVMYTHVITGAVPERAGGGAGAVPRRAAGAGAGQPLPPAGRLPGLLALPGQSALLSVCEMLYAACGVWVCSFSMLSSIYLAVSLFVSLHINVCFVYFERGFLSSRVNAYQNTFCAKMTTGG